MDRTTHTDRLTALARRKQEVERKVQDEVEKLARSDTWPVQQPQPQARAYPQDMSKYIDELKGTAAEIHTLLSDMSSRISGRQPRPASLPPRNAVDTNGGPPAKRRRLSDADEERIDHSRTASSPRLSSSPSSATLNSLSERLANIEDRLVAFENDMSTLTNDVDNDLGARLEYRLDDLLSQRMVDGVGEKLDGVEQKLDLAARDLEEFKEHVAELDSGADDVANGITDLAQTLHQLVIEPDNVEQRLIKSEEIQSNQHAQIQAIQAALAAHMSQPPPHNLPPAPTYPLNSEVVIETLEGLLQDSIRRKVLPSLLEMQETVEGRVRNYAIKASMKYMELASVCVLSWSPILPNINDLGLMCHDGDILADRVDSRVNELYVICEPHTVLYDKNKTLVFMACLSIAAKEKVVGRT
ncbi:ATP-dependent rRNA helicase [Salix suchowensis]|nr:ATP-dependent rRNA helicase [Salix suchowensis]